jgi:hypothetical protein
MVLRQRGRGSSECSDASHRWILGGLPRQVALAERRSPGTTGDVDRLGRLVADDRQQDDGGAEMVGAAGFEPTTTSPPDWCATRLRHAPTRGRV